MKIALVTDSTNDLPRDVIEKYNIGVVPMYINVGDKGYWMVWKCPVKNFLSYTRLAQLSSSIYPTTGCPALTLL